MATLISGNSGSSVGFVRAVTGNATATSSEGATRVLLAGDMVFADEVIQTDELGSILIEFNDGGTLALGRESQALLDNEVANFDTTVEPADVSASVEVAQTAIAAGDDPSATLEAPAAGPAGGVIGGGGGTQVTEVDRIGDSTTPESGFETTGLEFSGDDGPEFVGAEVVEADDTPVTPVNDAPTIDVVANDFTEDAGAAVGDVAGTYTTDDEEGDAVTVTFNTASTHYTLDTANGEVELTQAGVDVINAGGTLDAIDLKVTQDNDTSLTGTDSDTPVITPVNDAPPVAVDDSGYFGAGLAGEYYGYKQGTDGGNLLTVQQVKDYVASRNAEVTFVSSQINYGYTDSNNDGQYTAGEAYFTGDLADDVASGGGIPTHLANFLKQDGDDVGELVGASTQAATDGVIRLQGLLDIPGSGTANYDFEIFHDDGFVIYIDGVDVFGGY